MRALLACVALLLVPAAAQAQQPLPPPAASRATPALPLLPSTRAREPSPEPDAIKLRIDGEYELRQSVLSALPLSALDDGPPDLGQTSRLFHWLRLRALALFGTWGELRAEADLPRGLIYGQEPEDVPDNGTDFDRQQPLRLQPRMLRFTVRHRLGELLLGHTTAHLGMGLLDNDGDHPRWFGTPERPATFERIELWSGSAGSALRIGAQGDLTFEDGRIQLTQGDQRYRVGLSARFAPGPHAHLQLLGRYDRLRRRDELGGSRSFVFDLSGGFRSGIAGRDGELFGDYEAVYQVGEVAEPAALASSATDRSLTAVAAAARLGVALARTEDYLRYARLVASLEWGMASGDADPTDDELHRFVMNPNHRVGLLLFGEVLRFKTSRAQAALEASTGREFRAYGLQSRGGVAGATYLNPVILVRPTPDLVLKAGAVVASSTKALVDPAALLARGERQNFDGGSPLGRSLGTELDVGGEITLPLQPPMLLRLSLEAGVLFPGSAFDDAAGNGLGTQAIATAGLGLTF